MSPDRNEEFLTKEALVRRELLKGLISFGAGVVIGGGSTIDLMWTLSKKNDQSERAKKKTVEEKKVSSPTPQELEKLNQVRNDIRANPLADRNENDVRVARQIEEKKVVFDKAHNESLKELEAKEGTHKGRLVTDGVGITIGAGTGAYGITNVLTTMSKL